MTPLAQAIDIINSGGVIIFPTETVYGIGTSIKSEEGIKRIYDIKGREKEKPLQILISNKEHLKSLVEVIPEKAQEMIDKYWPGPLTLVFKKIGGGTIGLRMPDNKIILRIIDACGPIAATSANISGEPAPCKASDVKIEADLVLEGGICQIQEASTVIDFSVSPPQVLRQGKILL